MLDALMRYSDLRTASKQKNQHTPKIAAERPLGWLGRWGRFSG